MQNVRRDKKKIPYDKSEYTNVLFSVPLTRWERYEIARQYFREGSPKEVFFESENYETNDELQRQISNTLTSRYEAAQTNGTYVVENKFEAQIMFAPNGKEIDLSSAPNKPFQLLEVRTEQGKQSRKEIRKKEGRDSTKRGKDDKKYIPNDSDIANCLTTGSEAIEKWTFEKGQIRRLTPVECERLMSWPDDWTRWGINEKGEKVEISDSQRYKMCGNGVVSNCVREIVKELFAPQQTTG